MKNPRLMILRKRPYTLRRFPGLIKKIEEVRQDSKSRKLILGNFDCMVSDIRDLKKTRRRDL